MNRLPKNSLPTPALMVDLDLMESNLRVMSDFFAHGSSRLRPHFKNHRVIAFAKRQLAFGALGITASRLWQVEALCNAGITGILLANEVVREAPLKQLADLSTQCEIIAAADNAVILNDMARVARAARTTLDVVIDVNLGMNRCGVAPGAAALELAILAQQDGLKFRGLMGYEGHLQPLVHGPDKATAVADAMQQLVHSRTLIEDAGIGVEIVSCGGTADFQLAGRYPGVTEHQGGSFMLMDEWYAPFAPEFSPTLTLLVTVISKGCERLIADAGVKAMSGERGLCKVKGRSDLKVVALHAEHAVIDIVAPGPDIAIGDTLELAVQYHDGTIHLHRRLFGLRDGILEETFEIVHES